MLQEHYRVISYNITKELSQKITAGNILPVIIFRESSKTYTLCTFLLTK